MDISTKELKLLIENIIPENIRYNHLLFKQIFDEFFNYMADTYKLGSDSYILLETDKKLWEDNSLNNVDLSGIKGELVKTYLHDYNIFFERLKNDDQIHKFINRLYEVLGINKKFDAESLIDVINEEEFLIHKKFSQQKTIGLIFNYISDLVSKTKVGQINDEEAYFKMYEGTFYNPRKAFAYTIDTSLFKTIYDSSIKPMVHPLGFSYGYYHEVAHKETDYFNMDTEIQDFKLFVLDTSLEINSYKEDVNKNPAKCCEVNPTKIIPQFIPPVVNSLSSYGGLRTTLEGNTFIRSSDGKYKLVSDGIEQFDGEINNCILMDWNLDTNSYVLETPAEDDNDIRKDLYGAVINFNELTKVWEVYVGGNELPQEDAYVEDNKVFIRKFNEELGEYYFEKSKYLGVKNGFITFNSTESMYSLEALKLTNYNDNIKVYSLDDDKVFNPYGGCHSFFITLLDMEEEHYIWSSKRVGSNYMSHYISIDNNGINIVEVNGISSTGYFNFEANRRYYIVFNWDENGRSIYVDGNPIFVQDLNKQYNEKLYVESTKPEEYNILDYVNVKLKILRKTLSYQELSAYDETKEILLKVSYKKGNVILFDNESEIKLQNILDEIESNNIKMINDMSNIRNELLRRTSLSKDNMYIVIETNRVTKLLNDAQLYIDSSKNFDVILPNETIKFDNFQIEIDEGKLRNMFLNIEGEEIIPYYILPSDAKFEYYTEINEIQLGNPWYFEEQGISKVNYILDNFDIINKPLTTNEIISMFENHDEYIKSDLFLHKGYELYFSLDRKIFEKYHNEMTSLESCFSPWYIGESQSIGLDDNLLIMYYNNTATCTEVYDIDDCKFGDYLDHPKSKVDESLEYNSLTSIYENIVNVVESEENGKPKLIAYLLNNTRIEYIKGVYWRHINNENGTIIEEKSKTTVMDYSYQIKVKGTSTNDGINQTPNTYIFDLGEIKRTKQEFYDFNLLEKVLKERNIILHYNKDMFVEQILDGKTYYTSVENYVDFITTHYDKMELFNLQKINNINLLCGKDSITNIEELKVDKHFSYEDRFFYDDMSISEELDSEISDKNIISSEFEDGLYFKSIRNDIEQYIVNDIMIFENGRTKSENIINSCDDSITLPQTFLQKDYINNTDKNVTLTYLIY